MKELQIALNTESVLDYLDSDARIATAFRAAYEAGYRSVELWHVAKPENGGSWKPLLDEAGLHCCAIHELFEEVMEDPNITIQKAKSLSAPIIAIGRSRDTVWENLSEVKLFAKQMNELGRRCKDEGISLVYHNHNTEFVRSGGRLALDVFFDLTDPDFVGSELDVYWVQMSGANPVEWCNKLRHRLQVIHLKDVGIQQLPDGNFIKRPVCTTLGLGNLDLQSIIPAAENAGCQWFVVETCTDWIDNDSLRCAKESYAFLRDTFCKK